jgi:gliding motility-associated-like protein
VSPVATQDYYVTYTSPDGCSDSDTVTVTVTNIYSYFMPTGFSPNGDGLNDVIQVHGKGIDFINLKIFDRIGEKVFETSDITDSWDGRLHKNAMNSNVFVYMLEVTFCNGETAKEQGNITLVK